MYRLFAAVFLCLALMLMMPGKADARGGCRGYRGYSHGYYPRVSYGYRPHYYGPGYYGGGYYGGGYRPYYNSYYRGGFGYQHYGGRSFISIGIGF